MHQPHTHLPRLKHNSDLEGFAPGRFAPFGHDTTIRASAPSPHQGARGAALMPGERRLKSGDSGRGAPKLAPSAVAALTIYSAGPS